MKRSSIFRPAGILAICLLISGAIATGGTQVSAAPLVAPVAQCNNDTASNVGGQGLACTVTIANYLTSSGTASAPSTITVTRCFGAAGPIAAGAGTCTTTTTTSAQPVVLVTQCDGSANGGGGVLICTVTMTNTFSGIPAQAVTPATVYQCIGSAITGTGAPGTCTPVNTPGVTSVAAATVGQCNNSGNGGTSVGFVCTVTTGSTTTLTLPVNIDQCNGSTNGGGALTTCRATVTSVIAAAPPVATTTPAPVALPVAATPTPPLVATPAPAPAATPAPSPITSLPSTSTAADTGALALLGAFLVLIGLSVVRRRRAVPAKH